MAFRWRAEDGPFIVVFGSSIPSSTKKSYQIRTPSDKTLDPRIIPLFHTGPESHESTRIDKYLDSWLNHTQFVMVLTDSHSP